MNSFIIMWGRWSSTLGLRVYYSLLWRPHGDRPPERDVTMGVGKFYPLLWTLKGVLLIVLSLVITILFFRGRVDAWRGARCRTRSAGNSGPLSQLSKIRFEAEHRPLKQGAQTSSNRINLPYTIALKSQLHLSQIFFDNNGLI